MAITVAGNGRSITIDATNAAIALAGPRRLIALNFQGSGLTAAQQFAIRDSSTVGSGNILADHTLSGANESADLWGGRPGQIVTGLSIDNTTVGGTWRITATFEP